VVNQRLAEAFRHVLKVYRAFLPVQTVWHYTFSAQTHQSELSPKTEEISTDTNMIPFVASLRFQQPETFKPIRSPDPCTSQQCGFTFSF
jgi:hypothetical protein